VAATVSRIPARDEEAPPWPPALITGAAGLIGRHVLEQWRDLPYDPVPVQRGADDLLVGGAVQRVLDRVRPEVVVHLAWTASGTPDYRTSAENDRWRAATLPAAKACLDRGLAFCGTGTGPWTRPKPTDAYSASKHALRRELEPPHLGRRDYLVPAVLRLRPGSSPATPGLRGPGGGGPAVWR
jgi:hypothetical protein